MEMTLVFFEGGLKPERKWEVIKPRDLSVSFEEALGLLVKAGYVNGK